MGDDAAARRLEAVALGAVCGEQERDSAAERSTGGVASRTGGDAATSAWAEGRGKLCGGLQREGVLASGVYGR